MTFSDQLGDWSLVQGPGDEEHDVVDHVAVGDVVHELGQSSRGLVPHVLELGHQLLPQLILNHGDLKSAFIGQEVAVVRGLKVELEVLQGLALDQVQIVVLTEDPCTTTIFLSSIKRKSWNQPFLNPRQSPSRYPLSMLNM